MAFGHGKFVPFDAEAFYAAWFAARRFGVGSKLAHRRDIPYADLRDKGKASGKLPQDVYERWHRYHCGYLPVDRELLKGSLIGARDREYAVCRLKYKFLKNSRAAREPPRYFVCDEQLSPYFGHMSGLKKRMPKKKLEGIEYWSLAT